VNDGLRDGSGRLLPLGLVDGNPGQIVYQAIGVLISWGLAIAGTYVILRICDAVVGLRVHPEHETQGLDLSLHGEQAYNLEH